MYTLVYSINNEPNPETVYINLTNACTNSCVFCLREQKDDVCGAQMWHDGNYKLENIISQFEDYHGSEQKVKNVVFCGYGEPFLKKRYDESFCSILERKLS